MKQHRRLTLLLTIVLALSFTLFGCNSDDSATKNEAPAEAPVEAPATEAPAEAADASHALVFMTDFGLKDSAVSAMKGVAFGVDPELKMFDVTHEIPAYNIWEASYRLYQVAAYWPEGTVFVSVVDPGVGTDRKSVVMKDKAGHYFVTPDNGTLGLVAEDLGIESIREIDESKNRLQGSEDSYTFHGRDVYAYTGARLASGTITYEEVGPELPAEVVTMPYQKAELKDDVLSGNIPILDVQYGNVWSNIGKDLADELGIKIGDMVHVEFYQGDKQVYAGDMKYCHTFGDVEEGQPLLYLNELLYLSAAINMDSFSDVHEVYAGND